VCLVECSDDNNSLECQAVIKLSYGGERGSDIGQLDGPVYLSVDKNCFILVADWGNNRLVVLNDLLQFSHVIKIPDIVISQGPLFGPRRLYLDEPRDRLYVGENSGRVLVLKLSQCLNI
jgi:hypothetical protein